MTARERVLANERATRPIAIRPAYVRLTGSFDGAVLLSQILYWFGNDGDGNPRARVSRDGELWIAKSGEAWAIELGALTPEGEPRRPLIRRTMKELEGAGLIFVKVWKFNGAPTTHVRPNWDALETALSANPLAAGGQSKDLTRAANGNDAGGQSLTETTAETTIRDYGNTPRATSNGDVGAGGGSPVTVDSRVNGSGVDGKTKQWAPFYDAVQTSLGGVQVYKAGGVPVSWVGKLAGQFGGAAPAGVAEAVELWGEFEAWARRSRYASGVRWDFVSPKSIEGHAGKFLADRARKAAPTAPVIRADMSDALRGAYAEVARQAATPQPQTADCPF